MNSRCAWRVSAFLAHIIAIFAVCPRDAMCEEIHDPLPRRHFIGISAALYDIRFIDDVISPVVYTSSSPLYELFYRYIANSMRASVSMKASPYTARLQDSDGNDDFVLLDSGGQPYSYPRSLHTLDGFHFELEGFISGQVFAQEHNRIALNIGGGIGLYGEELSITNYAGYDYAWTSESWLDDASLALEAALERSFRRLDRLSLVARFTLFADASRPPYSFEIERPEEADPKDAYYDSMEDSNFSILFPNAMLRWSLEMSYELRLGSAIGLEAYYRFQHENVSEPRDLRYVSHMLGLGVEYGIK